MEPAPPDDTLQRTLLLAQKFVDETKADAETQAAQTIAEAESKARMMTEDAQSQATKIAAESEQRLRDEISRLESSRSKLTNEVDSMSRHLEGERNRLRSALGDILRWVDENVQPARPPTETVSTDTETAPAQDGAATRPAPDPAPAPLPHRLPPQLPPVTARPRRREGPPPRSVAQGPAGTSPR